MIESARSGDTSAFAELWRRHFRPAARVARQFTTIDADDLVSEAYARIFQRVLAGGGPTGAFRPYLYTTIRNIASTWGAASRDIQVDMIEEFEDERIPADPAAYALDRTLTARAFRNLPERWQTVLWYTEVEGMDPHEVAPIMGISANSVAALSYRAREGLRKAWLQAHITDATASGECQWTMSRLGDHTRDGLSARDAARMTVHLETCAKCTVVAEEVEEVGSHLAMVMLPLLLGGIAGGTLLSQLAQPAGAMAAEVAIPAMPPSVEAIATGGVAAGSAIAGAFSLGSTLGTGAVLGGVAVAAVLGAGIAVGTAAAPDSGSSAVVATSDDTAADAPPSSSATDPASDPGPAGPSPSAVPADPGTSGGTGGTGGTGAVGGVAGGVTDTVGTVVDEVTDVVEDTVQDVATVVQQPVVLNVSVSGTGTPGASVSLKAGGTVYATAKVGSNGKYAISAGGIPDTVGSLSVVQKVDQGLLGGIVNGVLQVLKPLTISSSSGGLPVIAVG
ncbi:MAG TPA: sigma-70 family RNA polymerase sigma factor [Pseudolysinimonas sp.]|nr:sigma-70 family RNA polymerase sigma factor [Pseudolysinimonas sp.]